MVQILSDFIKYVQICIESLLSFCGCDVSDGFEQAAVVEPFDPSKCFPLDLAHGFPRPKAVDDLCLEQADDRLSEGVINPLQIFGTSSSFLQA